MSPAPTGIEREPVAKPVDVLKLEEGHVFERTEGGRPREIWLLIRIDKDEIIHRNHSRSQGGVQPYVILGNGATERVIPIQPRVIKIEGSGVMSFQRQHPHEEMRVSVNLKPEAIAGWAKENKLTLHCDSYGFPLKWQGLAGFSQELSGYDGLYENDARVWRRAIKSNQPCPFQPHPLWEELA